MEYAIHLLIVVVAARFFGRLAHHIGQPFSMGEILAGVVLALLLALLPKDMLFLSSLVESPALAVAGEIGIFFLLLYAGIEMRPKEIAEHSRESAFVALGGMVLPFCLGFALAWIVLPDSEWKQAQAFVVGTALSISAIAVAARVLMEFDLLHKPVGEIVVSAAIFDDILGLLLLAVLTSMIGSGHLPGADAIAWLGLKVVIFFLVTIGIGRYVYPWIWRRIVKHAMAGIQLSTLLAIALAFSLLAEALDMHMAIGAFMAGLFFEPKRVGGEIYDHTKGLIGNVTAGVFGPIFFASIGFHLSLETVVTVPGFLAALILIAFLGKLIGGGLPAYWCGMKKRDAMAVGVSLSGRGAIELIVAGIALKSGIFSIANGEDPLLVHLFSALVITAIVTTLLTPVLLRIVLNRPPGPGPKG
ncbi:MAG: cation:proton antiporter [Alphaproteobacteria bacterium]